MTRVGSQRHKKKHGTYKRTAETKVLRTFIRFTSLIKLRDCALKLYTALARHPLTFASPAWEIVSGTHLLKRQGLEDEVFLRTDKCPRRTQIRKLHVAFRIPCFNNFIKICAGSKRKSYKIDFGRSMHRHTIQTNQPTRCSSLKSLPIDVYVSLNIFRAPPRPSSGAYNCINLLAPEFYI